jgi:hypothetical protein
MKVKELPLAIARTWGLRSKPVSKLLSPDKREVPVVISLTTIESRLASVDLVIRSLMDQTIRPYKILLWVNEKLEGRIPQKLAQLQSTLFEIRYTPLEISHKKLIHTLALYPDLAIITCDDDLMYRKTWLAKLFESSVRHPNTILANQIRVIQLNEKGQFLPYAQWPVNSQVEKDPRKIVTIGAEGVLYPPHSLDTRYDDKALFMQLAPKADDLWFKCMSLLKGTPCKLAEDRPKNAVPIMGSQKISLKNINIKKDYNSKQWAALVAHFKLDLSN